MKTFFLLLMTSLFLFSSYAEETVVCDGECQNDQCSDIEKLSLIDVQNKVQLGFGMLELKDVSNPKEWTARLHDLLKSINETRTKLRTKCLSSFCQNQSNATYRKKLSETIILSGNNPLCYQYNLSPLPDIDSIILRMHNNNYQDMAQLTFQLSDDQFSLSLYSPYQNCKDNENGTFSNTFVSSVNSILIYPEDGTTPVENPPIGIELIKSKKSLSKFQIVENKIQFDLGENFFVEVEPNQNVAIKTNLIKDQCIGTVIRNKQKGTSRMALQPQSINDNKLKKYTSNQWQIIKKETQKVPW